jgi:hypothetical protein
MQNLRTLSSGVKCSEGDTLRLYAAQRISRDFFKVSSILQAVKSAAAAASGY